MALAAREGQDDLLLALWDRVRPFVAKLAMQRLNAFPSQAVDTDDLVQSGFLALLEAVRTYRSDMECSFITWLSYQLKNAFNEALGVRSERQKRDPIHHALSLDAPLSDDDPEGGTLGDTVPDECDQFEDADERLWTEQLKQALDTALQDLPEAQASAIRMKYMDGRPLPRIAEEMDVKASKIHERANKGLCRLRRGPHGPKLASFLCPELERMIDERTGWYYGMGLTRFKERQTSGVELLVLQREGMRRNMRGGSWRE